MNRVRAGRWVWIAGFLLGFVLFPQAWSAPPDGLQPQEEKLPTGGLALSLQDAILMAFKNHADITVAKLEIPVQGADISVARSLWDPRFVGSGSYRESEIPIDDQPTFSGNTLDKSENTNILFSAEVTQRYYTGTEASVFLRSSRNRGQTFIGTISLPPVTELRPQLGVAVTQPLLKGLSISANKADIQLAQNNYAMSRLDFRLVVEGILADVENRYWEAIFARENLQVKQASLVTAQEVFRISQARFDVGDVAELEVITAEADVKAQAEEIIRARNHLENAEDRLAKAILPPDAQEVGRRQIRPTDEPTMEEVDVDLQVSIETALERRPDLRRRRRELRQASILQRRAQHDLLPTLNLTGSYAVNGLGRDPGNAYKEMFTGDFADWGVGLTLEVPIGNRLARGNLQKAKYQKQQAEVRLNNQEADIIYEVRVAARSVQSARERVRAAEAARVLADRRLEVERAKLEEGATIARAVLDAQEDLLAAQSSEIRARIDHRLAMTALQKSESTLIERHGIRLPDED